MRGGGVVIGRERFSRGVRWTWGPLDLWGVHCTVTDVTDLVRIVSEDSTGSPSYTVFPSGTLRDLLFSGTGCDRIIRIVT